jgi:hypothetical protein
MLDQKTMMQLQQGFATGEMGPIAILRSNNPRDRDQDVRFVPKADINLFQLSLKYHLTLSL